jgi:aspartyl-tRNA(Asn)/glutamyl-tRNA(Gln) amidotransferase subunit C
MSLSTEEVIKIAYLARLGIDEKDVDTYAKDLSSILDLITQMNETDTDNVLPMAHPMDKKQRLREDTVLETNQREVLQSIAPQIDSGFYLVPKVLD